MENIRNQISEKIAEIGAGESLLIFTEEQNTFIKFDAKVNGKIQMTADNGNIEVEFTRDFTFDVIEDFSIIEKVKKLPLKTIKLNADGQFQVDGEPDTHLEAGPDGIADRSMVPLGEQIKAALLSILPNLNPGKLNDPRKDGSLFSYELDNGFTLWIECGEPINQMKVKAVIQHVTDEQIEAFRVFPNNRILPYMVQFFSVKTLNYDNAVDFLIELPAVPFIGQHLVAALNSLAESMQIWIDYNGGNIER
ncbi:MAG: hypothetical protein RLZZ330_218 [Actinomycetota bacterium]|jgi:hypothetical protein